jgi:hypothetical protein
MNPWRRLACHVAPLLVSLLVGFVLVQLFGNRYQPRIIEDGQVFPAIVQPGTIAEVRYAARDERECLGRSRRWIVDSKGIIYDLTSIPVFQHIPGAPSYETFKFVHEFPVPRGISDGPATYHNRVDRWCNVFQEWFWPIHSFEQYNFEVERPK